MNTLTGKVAGISCMLIGESKTGKTRAIETLPGGTVDFSFDKGGWRTLDPRYDVAGSKGKKREKVLKFTPTFKEWLESGDTLGVNEILVVDYSVSDPIALTAYAKVDATLFLKFGEDFNQLWFQMDKCVERGVCHVVVDSLTAFQQPILDFVLALNAVCIPRIQDWGQAINKIDEVVQSALGIPFDFILTAHIQAEKDEITGRVKELPLVFGKSLPTKLLTKFDDIFMSGMERSPTGMSYYWATVPEGLLKGVGTRSFDDLAGRIEPNFKKLYGERLFKGSTTPSK